MINPLHKIEPGHVRKIVCTKIILSVSFAAVNYLPHEHAIIVSVVSNVVWLWKF